MPNKNYVAGVRCERKVMAFYREMGWEAVRTAGSHGLVDVVAWEPRGSVHLVQVKRCKAPRGNTWRDANWRLLLRRSPEIGGLHDITGGLWGETPRVYAFVYRHGKRTPEIYDAQGAREWEA